MLLCGRLNTLIVLLCLLSPICTVVAAQDTKPNKVIKVNTADTAPYSNPENTGVYDQLVQLMFKKIGLEIEISHLPSARSIENVDIGFADAEYARIKDISHQYDNILVVPEKLIDFAFTAFSKDPNIKINNWQDLKQYRIGYIRGWKIYESNVRSLNPVVTASGEKELFKYLENDRVDIILYEKLRGERFLLKNQPSQTVYTLVPPLALKAMHLLVHKKHQKSIDGLDRSLKEIKKGGEYQEILDSVTSR